MDFDQLITFMEVAKLGNFSRAGQKVFRSQSAVSAQIRQLEQEYGDRLLDRSGKDVTLTPAGRVFVAYAERLTQLRDESKLELTFNPSPIWSETNWFMDYVLPVGLSGERHDQRREQQGGKERQDVFHEDGEM